MGFFLIYMSFQTQNLLYLATISSCTTHSFFKVASVQSSSVMMKSQVKCIVGNLLSLFSA